MNTILNYLTSPILQAEEPAQHALLLFIFFIVWRCIFIKDLDRAYYTYGLNGEDKTYWT